MTANTVYILCTLMSLACAALLLRGYRRSRTRVLLFASLAFGAFAINNLLLFVDTVALPDLEFHGQFWRNLVGAVSGCLLLFGFVWEKE